MKKDRHMLACKRCLSRLYRLPLLALPLCCAVAQAQPTPTTPVLQDSNRPALITGNPVNQVLPIDAAFQLEAFAMASDSVLLRWTMPPGYYLYRKSLQIQDAKGRNLQPELPQAREITDEFFGNVQVYFGQLELEVPLHQVGRTSGATVLAVEYQGCAEDLYCYPPQYKQLEVALP
jgi:thiol:disulfide interchange protein